MKARDMLIATAVTGIGIGAIGGKVVNKLIDKNDSLFMKLGVVIGGCILSLMVGEKTIDWVHGKMNDEIDDIETEPNVEKEG